MVTIGEYIRRKRKEKGMTAKDLSEILKVSAQTVYNMESGRNPVWDRYIPLLVEHLGGTEEEYLKLMEKKVRGIDNTLVVINKRSVSGKYVNDVPFWLSTKQRNPTTGDQVKSIITRLTNSPYCDRLSVGNDVSGDFLYIMPNNTLQNRHVLKDDILIINMGDPIPPDEHSTLAMLWINNKIEIKEVLNLGDELVVLDLGSSLHGRFDPSTYIGRVSGLIRNIPF